MTIASHDLILVDTNILVHWIRQDPMGRHLLDHYHLEQREERPVYSTVTEGEILGLARLWNWGESKNQTLTKLLDELVRLESSHPEVVRAYGDLYFQDQRNGWNTGENDLWIAASAKVANAVLLTCDRDFLRLSPNLVRVEYVVVAS
ncbi:MAG: type II toxin-antitoxin system VapC family toxin [Pirellulales bacterium]